MDNIIYKIFSNEPMNSNEIELNFDGIENAKDLFECLLMFLTNGLKTLYGDKNGIVNLNDLSRIEFFKVQKYFSSFGFELFYDKVIINNINDLKLHLNDYRNLPVNTKFNEYIFSIHCKPYVYKFRFDFLN